MAVGSSCDILDTVNFSFLDESAREGKVQAGEVPVEVYGDRCSVDTDNFVVFGKGAHGVLLLVDVILGRGVGHLRGDIDLNDLQAVGYWGCIDQGFDTAGKARGSCE